MSEAKGDQYLWQSAQLSEGVLKKCKLRQRAQRGPAPGATEQRRRHGGVRAVRPSRAGRAGGGRAGSIAARSTGLLESAVRAKVPLVARQRPRVVVQFTVAASWTGCALGRAATECAVHRDSHSSGWLQRGAGAVQQECGAGRVVRWRSLLHVSRLPKTERKIGLPNRVTDRGAEDALADGLSEVGGSTRDKRAQRCGLVGAIVALEEGCTPEAGARRAHCRECADGVDAAGIAAHAAGQAAVGLYWVRIIPWCTAHQCGLLCGQPPAQQAGRRWPRLKRNGRGLCQLSGLRGIACAVQAGGGPACMQN